jgi:hypothetical protein
MIKSLAVAAILAIGLSGVAFADDAAPAAAPAMAKPMMHKGMGKGNMCYHTVGGKKVWHKSATACGGGMKKMAGKKK